MKDNGYYDDLGGAYYFADEQETFEARTPKSNGCGCFSASACVFLCFTLMIFYFLA